MARREIPLFILDRSRKHKVGPYDFLVCTDKDNGFVAKVDYVIGMGEISTDMVRIGAARNGILMRIEIKRMTGKNPDSAQIRSLLKKGMEYCSDILTVEFKSPEYDTQTCIEFLERLIEANRQSEDERPLEERQVTQRSVQILEAIEDKLRLLQTTENTN